MPTLLFTMFLLMHTVTHVHQYYMYCMFSLFRHVNKVKRYNWVLDQLANIDQYKNVIWTDESKIELQKVLGRQYRKEGEQSRRPRPKHATSVGKNLY